VLSAEHGFHGLTLGSLSANGNPEFSARFGPLLPGFDRVPFGDLDALEQQLRSEDVALFLVEPIQGKGVHLPPATRKDGRIDRRSRQAAGLTDPPAMSTIATAAMTIPTRWLRVTRSWRIATARITVVTGRAGSAPPRCRGGRPGSRGRRAVPDEVHQADSHDVEDRTQDAPWGAGRDEQPDRDQRPCLIATRGATRSSGTRRPRR
jgi:hypothetical protein